MCLASSSPPPFSWESDLSGSFLSTKALQVPPSLSNGPLPDQNAHSLREKVQPMPRVVPGPGSSASLESRPARLCGFRSSLIPSNRFKIVPASLVVRVGEASFCCPLPPPGGGVPSTSCSERSPVRVLAVLSKVPFWLHFSAWESQLPRRQPCPLARDAACHLLDLSVHASDCLSVVVLGSFCQALCSCVHYWT